MSMLLKIGLLWLCQWASAYQPLRPRRIATLRTRHNAAAVVEPMIAPRPVLPLRAVAGGAAALALGGTGALCATCGLAPGAAAWLVVMTMTTTGFGDVCARSVAGKVVCSGIALVGVGLVGCLAARVVEAWVEENLLGGVARKAREPRTLALSAVLLLLCGAAGLAAGDGLHAAEALYLAVGVATSTGYGDLVPRRPRTRAFAAIFSVVSSLSFSTIVGRIALAPLARAKAAAREAARTAYGDRLTPNALDELARGRLVQSLGLNSDASMITRNEFVLLLLVKQGLVSSGDLDVARARFDALDASGTGVLDQRDLDLLAKLDAPLLT